MRLVNIVVLTLVTCLGAGTACAEGNPDGGERVLEVGYAEFPPYEYTDDNGNPAGSFIEVTKLTLQRAGYRARFHSLPISRTYLYLQEGRIDLWPGLSEVPALQGHVLESKAVPTRIRLNAWYMEGTPPIRDIPDMRGRSVILISGYTYGGLLYFLNDPKNDYQVITTRTHLSALQMLEKRRGQYLLDYVEPVQNILNEHPIANLRSVALSTRNASFIVSRKTKGAEEVLRSLDHAYEQLKAEKLVQFIEFP